jgi:ABC-type nickel/cobalt efflux system permease component RcnA
MLANERALFRGVVLSALAALLQALVAVAIVGVAAVLLGVTAQKMASATHWVEIAAYFCIAGLGAWLVWRKGADFLAAWRAPLLPASNRFQCQDLALDDLAHPQGCAHCVAPDPARLGADFSWRQGLVTVAAAGARPCSGALLVLVFAFAHGAFSIGVWATFAMAAGTALTTGALASGAVLAKGVMTKVLGAQTRRGEIASRLLEVVAACVVLFLGLSLLVGMAVSGQA